MTIGIVLQYCSIGEPHAGGDCHELRMHPGRSLFQSFRVKIRHDASKGQNHKRKQTFAVARQAQNNTDSFIIVFSLLHFILTDSPFVAHTTAGRTLIDCANTSLDTRLLSSGLTSKDFG